MKVLNQALEIISSIYELDKEFFIVNDEKGQLELEFKVHSEARFTVRLLETEKQNKQLSLLSIKQSRNGFMSREDFDTVSALLEVIENDFQQQCVDVHDNEEMIAVQVDVICRAFECLSSFSFSVIQSERAPEPDQLSVISTSPVTGLKTITRMWLKLVSLSTKSKRDDLVEWGRDAGFTGFVMAGKPGLLCFEADTAASIDSFMSLIKTKSWADIPAVQKKITVVLVEEILHRSFKDLQEITHLFSMSGFLVNKPDLGQVRDYLFKNNVGHVFEKVFI